MARRRGWVTYDEAAEQLGRARSTIARSASLGYFPTRRNGQRVLVNFEEAKRYYAEHPFGSGHNRKRAPRAAPRARRGRLNGDGSIRDEIELMQRIAGSDEQVRRRVLEWAVDRFLAAE